MNVKSVIASMAVIAVLSLASCDESSKLANSVAGTWSGSPRTLIDNSASSATLTESYSFLLDEGSTKGGSVMRTALISVTGQIQGTEAIIQPFALTAGATASIQGNWEASSDDDIHFTWIDSTLTVNIDPSAVTLSTNLLTGQERPAIDSLKPQLAESIRAQVAQAIEVEFLGTRKFDDIKIKKNLMEYEVNDKDYIMAKQGE